MQTRILSCTSESLLLAKQYIERGEIVAFHTETVYGLGANAFDDGAVQRIFSLKGRPPDNPLIVHVHRDYCLNKLVDEEPDYAETLRKRFLPGPLTMVYPSRGRVSGYVSSGMQTLAVRVPSSPVAQAFLKAVDLPVAAPSANLSKHVSPVTANHVYDDFQGKIPLILDGGACEGGIESTVLDCTGKVPQILREGLVTREMIASVTGECGVYRPAQGEKPKSPGMAYKHYAPRCRTAYFTADETDKAQALYEEELASGGKPCYFADESMREALNGEMLSLGKTSKEMARRLYAQLRRGEKEYTLLIAIEPRRRDGVMAGVMNRFTRAFGRDTED